MGYQCFNCINRCEQYSDQYEFQSFQLISKIELNHFLASTFTGNDHSVYSLAMNPSGTVLASGSPENVVSIVFTKFHFESFISSSDPYL